MGYQFLSPQKGVGYVVLIYVVLINTLGVGRRIYSLTLNCYSFKKS